MKKNGDTPEIWIFFFFCFSKCWRVFAECIKPPADREADVCRKQFRVQQNHAGPLKKQKPGTALMLRSGPQDSTILSLNQSVKYMKKPFTGCKTETSLVTNKASTSQRRKQRLWKIFTSRFYLFTRLTVDAVKIKVKKKFKQ